MINHNKAYLIGLIVGGGKLDEDTFIIELPFKKWGMDPSKMGTIAVDILDRISKLFKKNYDLNVTYEIGNRKWIIKPLDNNSISLLKKDLAKFGLPESGFLLNTADLTQIKSEIKGIVAESFLSGIFDARASIAKSHRRFNDEAPVVSLEIPGSTKNFKFVVQLCSWLTDLGSTTDQILYNHPNQHSGSDPYYSGWKKGFKIRFLVKSFLAKHSFALQAKAIDIKKIEKSQTKTEQDGCPFRKIKSPSIISVHQQNDSESLPSEVNNKLFFHYFHICAAMGCKHAPVKEVEKLVKNKQKYISFFPRLSKGSIQEISTVFKEIKQEHFKQYKIKSKKISVKILVNTDFSESYLGVKQGIAYLFSEKLNGKRHIGPMEVVLKENLDKVVTIHSFQGLKDEPLRVSNLQNDRSIVISSKNSKTNSKLIRSNTISDGLNIILNERN